MQAIAKAGLLRIGGLCACVASLLFVLAVVHILIILPRFGFQMEMLDDRRMLLPWMAAHSGAYRLLWQYYFGSLLFLLPVPLALHALVAREQFASSGAAAVFAVIGTVATALAMIGVVVIYSTSPTIAHAYLAADANQANTVLLGDLFADLGKEIRLFSELLLGIWLGGTGVILLRQLNARVLIGLLILVGVYTCGVAIIKIIDPLNPLEDTLGFLLAVAYFDIGWLLVRSERPRANSPEDQKATRQRANADPSGQ